MYPYLLRQMENRQQKKIKKNKEEKKPFFSWSNIQFETQVREINDRGGDD